MDRNMLVEEVMRRSFVVTDTDKPITYVLRLMERIEADGFVVVEGGKLVGLATYWDLMTRLGNVRVRSADISSIYASSVMEPVRKTLTLRSSIVEAARIVAEDPFHIIPVLEDGKVVGIIEPRDLAKALLDEEVPASNISLKSVPTIAFSDRVVHARRLMIESGLRSLASTNEGIVIGVVNDDQIVDAYVNLVLVESMERQKARIKSLVVADVGSRHVKASYDSSLGEVAKLIIDNPVKGAPLIDSEKALAGFVTVRELAKFISAQA
ncbi:MAG: CBS domain-containing protein [Candidatus Nezhaarchaeales archaeon]